MNCCLGFIGTKLNWECLCKSEMYSAEFEKNLMQPLSLFCESLVKVSE